MTQIITRSVPAHIAPTVISFLDGHPCFLQLTCEVVRRAFENTLQSYTPDFLAALPPEYRNRLREVMGTSKPTELRWIFDQATLPLYRLIFRKSQKVEVLGNLPVVCGHVARDGLGDYFQMIETARILQEHFQCKITILADVALLSQRRSHLWIPDSTQFQVLLHEGRSEIAEKLIASATLIVETPLAPNYQYLSPPIVIHEYDWDAPTDCATHLIMGLGTFTLGIPIKKTECVGGFETLKDTNLKTILLEECPSTAEYHTKKHFFVGYLKSDQGIFPHDFVFSCCFYSRNDNKNVDVLIPLPLISRSKKTISFRLNTFQQCGIERIELYQRDVGGVFQLTEKLGGNQGKKLRVINPFPIQNPDLLILFKASHGYLGCTGDLTLSEAISCRKIPFYQTMPHKKRLFESFYMRAPGLHAFLRHMATIGDRDLGAISDAGESMDPAMEETMKKVADDIEVHHCFNPVLIDLVYREQAFKKHYEIKWISDQLFDSYLKNKTTLSECFTQLQEEICSFSVK